jgi:putative ABC transport system permease protein
MSCIKRLFSRRRLYGDLSDEIGGHLDEKVEELMAGGMSRKEAAAAARREFGNVMLVEEDGRAVWGWASAENFLMDLRYGLRTLRNSPSFTLVVILTLALGIGANTAIFSVVNAVLLRPLPFSDSAQLVQVVEHDQKRGVDLDWVSYPNFRDWAQQNKVFESIAAYKFHVLNLTNVSQPQVLFGAKVSANLLPTLGAEPLLGRNFLPEEDQPGRDHEIILSYEVWRDSFAADPKLIGKALTLNGELYTVVGVMPARFNFPPTVPVKSVLPSTRAGFWAPLGLTVNPGERDWNMLGVIARLRTGTTIAQARTDLDVVARGLEWQYPVQNRGIGVRVEPLLDQVVGDLRPALLIFLGAICLVLLVACANVANLLVARSTTRQREIALRTSLGASRARLVRQLLTENLLLAVAGGALGLLLAYGGIFVFVALSPENVPRLGEIAIDGRVLAYTFGVSVLTGMLFGLAPALGASRADLSRSFKGEVTQASFPAKYFRLRNALVISEIALSLALLIGAGLLLKSFVRLEQVDPGFQPNNLLTVWMALPEAKYRQPQQRVEFYRQALERIQALPGVRSVGTIDSLPLSGIHGGGPFTKEGRPNESDTDAPVADRCVVSVNYFPTMGISLLQGREFTERDRDGATVVLMINETAARRYWPGEDPVGKRLSFSTGSTPPTWLTVVGVVKDVLQYGLDVPAKPTIYLPFLQLPEEFMVTVVRTGVDPSSVSSAVRGAIAAVDKEQPLLMTRTMAEIYSDSVAQRRFNTILIAAFASLALVLAMVGVYGLMTYAVTGRVHEMGVRVALGAQRWDVLRLVLGQGLGLTLAGIGFGLGVSFALTGFISKLLFNVPRSDPVTFVAVSLSLGAIALLACYLPARRAARVDPMVALRYE